MQPHKHAALIKAWADGAAIQLKTPHNGWMDVGAPYWHPEAEYRVKPKVPQIVELFADCGTSERNGNWRVTGMGGYRPNMRLSFDPDSGELLSVEKI